MSPNPNKKQLDEWSIEAQRELAEGSPERATELCRRLVEAWTRVQGPDGERVLVWRGFLGRALVEARRYREAEEVLLSLLVDRARVEGDEALGTLVTRGNLARAIALGGRPHEGIVLAQRLLDDRIRLFGEDHPSTLDVRGNIAHFHFLAGLNQEAIRLYEALLIDRERVLGPTHPAVAMTEANLAAVCSKASGSEDDLDDMCQLAQEMLDDLGPDHAETIGQYALVADQLVQAGRFNDALGYSNWTCDARARLFGERNALTVSARMVRSRCLVGLGRTSEACGELEHLVKLLDDMGMGGDATSLTARADLLALLLDVEAERHEADVVYDLWCGLFDDSRHLEPGNPLREWIEEQADRFEEVEEADADDDGDGADVTGGLFRSADLRHYRTAFIGLPMFLFGDMGPAVIMGFLQGVGPGLLAAIWQQAADEPIDQDQFTVDERLAASGARVIVIEMPSTGAPTEAAYLGVYVPAAMMALLVRHADDDEAPDFGEDVVAAMGVRLFSIEHALFGTMIGEIRVGQHLNLGMGPDPSLEAMFAVVAHETEEELV